MSCEYCDPERYHEEPCEKHGGTGACFNCGFYRQNSPMNEPACGLHEERKLKHKFCFNCGSPLSDPTPLTLGNANEMDELSDCVEFLEHAYTGARAMDNAEGMERLMNALYILRNGLDRFIEDFPTPFNKKQKDREGEG